MNFNLPGSDCWETDSYQEKFIKEYFRKGVAPQQKILENNILAKKTDDGEIKNSIVQSKKSKRKRSKKRKLQDAQVKGIKPPMYETLLPNKRIKIFPNSETNEFANSSINCSTINISSVSHDVKESSAIKTRKQCKKSKRRKIKFEDIMSVSNSRKDVDTSSEIEDVTAFNSKSAKSQDLEVMINLKKKLKWNYEENLSKKKNKLVKKYLEKNSKTLKEESCSLNNKSKDTENEIDCSFSVSNDFETSKLKQFSKSNKFENSLAFKSSLLKEKAKQSLQAAKFRFLNEKLYTITGIEALQLFQNDKNAYKEYHQGYEQQVKKWPVNPLDLIISELRQKSKNLVIADMGCGDAKIAQSFPDRTVHSFDLVALNDHVTCCDISKVPLPSGSVDIVVFCLSLMGINLDDYILEAHRLLKKGGLLKIAEIESRIDDLQRFIRSIEKYGFSKINEDISHKMFVLLNFSKVKRKNTKNELPSINLKPCLYKKR